VIGSPSEDDKSFVTDQKAIQYLAAFPQQAREDLSTKYPGAGELGVDLLNKMLQFNPYFRITVDEALEHPFLEKVRKPEKEIFSKDAITIEFD
jgi:mitogen-activated protein kinase 1/3